MSPTGRSRPARRTRMSRRRTSAMAVKTSVVVAARGTTQHHIPMWEYVKPGRRSVVPALFEQQRLDVVLDARREAAVVHDQPRAGVPAQDGVVVAAGTDRLGAFVALH